MDPHYRKVDLQAPADLVYLHNNIKAVAQQKLDLAIPPQGEDAFRNQVQELVQEVFCLLTPPKSIPYISPLSFHPQKVNEISLRQNQSINQSTKLLTLGGLPFYKNKTIVHNQNPHPCPSLTRYQWPRRARLPHSPNPPSRLTLDAIR